MTQLVIVGEYLSGKDAEEGGPWTDGLGRMYKGFLRQSGIEPRECTFINVFDFVPRPRISLDTLLGTKKEGIPNMKPLRKGKYVKAEYAPALKRLWDRINHENPNLILACGDAPTWALCAGTNPIDAARGRITMGNSAINLRKVLPTYHPKTIVANWPMRMITLADLEKAEREMQFPEIRRPQRFIHIEPTLDEMEEFYQQYLVNAPTIASDIETKGHMITCVSFAGTADRALVVPFYSQAHPDGNYWRTPQEEYHAWQFVKRALRTPGARIGGQNYQYDMQYEWREMGLPNPQFDFDTMLLHHVLQPEMKKGLGFLASVYTDEIAWKGMHRVSATDKSIKRGDLE